ncbi:hypothetical protein HD806DRAFT_299653 [Xylariaceae sp. AK1471]|nr:hypothetical protein HD806DRAFT_299653 [Xylariaceae sp. AK1471]
MELDNVLAKAMLRKPRKQECSYVTSLRPSAMEPRRRPLRTYSKRTSSTETTEPAPKRQCIASSPITASQDGETPLTASESGRNVKPSLSTIDPSLPPPTKKNTITAFFGRILPQPQVTTPSSEPLSESTGPTITPPSSPPIITTKRKRVRRLKTRVVTQRIDDEETSDENKEGHERKKQIGSIHDIEPPAHARPPALSEATPNSLNQPESISRTRSKTSKRRENRRRDHKTASVQTTLSLSMTETGYTECKECDMLYNHLDKTDVKYHARHHAALLRAKARAGAKNNIVE